MKKERRWKWILTIALTFCMAINVLPFLNLKKVEAGVWPEVVSNDFYSYQPYLVQSEYAGGYEVELSSMFEDAINNNYDFTGTLNNGESITWHPGDPLPNPDPNGSYNGYPVVSMQRMFTSITTSTLNLSLFDTSNVINMTRMFWFSGITTLDLSSFNTSNVTDMSFMFYNCQALKTINLNGFDISNVHYMESMFDSCPALTSIRLDSFKVNKNSYTMLDGMFQGTCSNNGSTDVVRGYVADQATADLFNDLSSTGINANNLKFESIERTAVPTATPTPTAAPTATPTPTETPTPVVTENPIVAGRIHVQTFGDMSFKGNGWTVGTTGMGKRLEAISMKLMDQPYSGDIEYRTHIQTYGWENDWKKNGQMSGTKGEAKRLEAIQIQLTGEMAKHYDVYYCVHAQHFGWLGWAKNGESCGTAGYAYRIEALKLLLVKKGDARPKTVGKTDTAFYQKPTSVTYRTHVQTYGNMNWVSDGTTSGTSGQSKRMEAIYIKLANQEYSGDIQYKTHIQTIGWEKGWKKNGAMSGTSRQAKRLEAIQIQLTGDMANHYDIYYRVHAQHFGWLGWAKNGQSAGTAGYAYRLEAVQIRLIPKGQAAPGNTANAYYQK